MLEGQALAGLVGRVVGGYRIGSMRASGPTNVLSDGTAESDGAPVAIQVFHPYLGDDDGFRDRLRRIAESVRRLDHPAIVRLRDAGAEGPLAYLIYDSLAGGERLRERLPALVAAPLAERAEALVGLVVQVGGALAVAHAAGQVHGRVTPAAIVVDDDGRARLADFGLGALLGGDEGDGVDPFTVVPEYLAPEQIAAGGAVGPAADQYSLAIIAYELLTGNPPFRGETPAAVLRQHQSQPPPALGRLAPEAPAALDAVLARALAKEPADRYPDIDAFLGALLLALEPAAQPASAVSAPVVAAPAAPAPDTEPSGLGAPGATAAPIAEPPVDLGAAPSPAVVPAAALAAATLPAPVPVDPPAGSPDESAPAAVLGVEGAALDAASAAPLTAPSAALPAASSGRPALPPDPAPAAVPEAASPRPVPPARRGGRGTLLATVATALVVLLTLVGVWLIFNRPAPNPAAGATPVGTTTAAATAPALAATAPALAATAPAATVPAVAPTLAKPAATAPTAAPPGGATAAVIGPAATPSPVAAPATPSPVAAPATPSPVAAPATPSPAAPPTPAPTTAPTPAPTEPAAPAVAAIDGAWVHNFGEMRLTQQGERISGTYRNEFLTADGTLTGTLTGTILTGSWSLGGRTGPLRLSFTPGRNTFDGTFVDGGTLVWCGARPGAEFAAGCSAAGPWTNRITARSDCPMVLTRIDRRVTGTYCNGRVEGTIVRYVGQRQQTVIAGNWIVPGLPPGPLTLYLLGYDALQFQGNWVGDAPDEWCGWRDGAQPPAPCLLP